MIKKLPLIITLLALMLPGGMAMADDISATLTKFKTNKGVYEHVTVTPGSENVTMDDAYKISSNKTGTMTITVNDAYKEYYLKSAKITYDVESKSVTADCGAMTGITSWACENSMPGSVTFSINATSKQTKISQIDLVLSSAPLSDTYLKLTSQPLTLKEGETGQLQVTATDKDNATVTGLNYTYKSDNEGVATVAEDGTVTAVAAGTANITVSYAGSDKYDAAQATSTVTVSTASGRSPYDENRAVGRAENVTGAGKDAKKIVVDTHDELIAALQGTDPLEIYVKGDIEFDGADSIIGCKNKTLIGLPGARLFNNQDRTKDANGTEYYLSNAFTPGDYKDNLKAAIKDKDVTHQVKVFDWIKTTMSVDLTGILCFRACDNIIIRNLHFEGQGTFDIDGKDNLTFHGSTNMWVDHCSFQDGIDGNFDCIHGSDNIAVTWCKFFYEKDYATEGVTGDSPSGHEDSNLWGHAEDDAAKAEDRGKLNTTFANCWWASNCKQRMPRVRFGTVHIYNCYYNSSAASRCIEAGTEANITAENCVFDGTNPEKNAYKLSGTSKSSLQMLNWMKGEDKQSDYQDKTDNGTYYTPSYKYEKYDVTLTKEVVTNAENGAGPTLDIVEPTDAYSPATVDVTIKQGRQYTTLTSPYALDFTNSDVKAYVATGLTKLTEANALGILLDKVTLTQVQKVPAGTGIVVRAADKLAATETFQIPVVSDGEAANIAAIETNYMAPVLTKTYIGGNYKYWIDESCAFHRKKSDDFVLSNGLFSPSKPGYLAAGKSYLATPYSYEDGGEKYIESYKYDATLDATAYYATLLFDDSSVTGIATPTAPAQREVATGWHTIGGQRITAPTRPGIYIHNGKKVVVR